MTSSAFWPARGFFQSLQSFTWRPICLRDKPVIRIKYLAMRDFSFFEDMRYLNRTNLSHIQRVRADWEQLSWTVLIRGLARKSASSERVLRLESSNIVVIRYRVTMTLWDYQHSCPATGGVRDICMRMWEWFEGHFVWDKSHNWQ